MPCYHPSAIAVDRRAILDMPARRDTVTVPCGKCLGCRSDQGREWAIRIMHQLQMDPTACWFVTLTYSNEHLPGLWPDDERTFGTLDPDDVSSFLKRLRKRSKARISYYLCGEYGSAGDRPHYHVIFFGLKLMDRQRIGQRGDFPVFQLDMLEETWGMGSVDITSVSWKSASYVAGYVTKKAAEKAEPTNHLRVSPETGELHEVHPEFSRMSRRPAIGKHWIEKHYREVYPSDFVMMNGTPIKPPRYYDKRMEEIDPVLMEEVRHQRFVDAVEIGDEKLIMMEKIHRARQRTFNRRNTL